MPNEYPELEQKAKELSAEVAPIIRKYKDTFKDLGFCVFVMNLGRTGGFAYMSSVVRDDLVRSLIEFLFKVGMTDDRYTGRQLDMMEELYITTRRPGIDQR